MTLRIGSRKLVALDWDARDLRVVLFRARGDGIELLKAVSIPLTPNVQVGDAESMGAFVREALRQARIGVKNALIDMTRGKVVLNSLQLPPTLPEELPAMVQFQIVKELPFAADQATIDFAVSGDFDSKAPCEVLVAAVRNEDLAFFKQVASEAGLTLEKVGLRPHSNRVAMTTKAPELNKGTSLVVEVGPQLTEIDIIRDGVLRFSRAASTAMDEAQTRHVERRYEDSRISTAPVEDRPADPAAAAAIQNLLIEVSRSYDAYRATDPAAHVDNIIVAGSSGVETELAERLEARFRAKAHLYSPEQALDLTPQRARELRGFSAVLGMALSYGHKAFSRFDFLHPKRPISKGKMRLKKMPIAVATVVVFVAAAVAGYANYVRPEIVEADRIQKEVDGLREEADAVKAFAEMIDSVEAWRKSEQYWPEVLSKLADALPPEQEAYAPRIDFDTKQKAGRKSKTWDSSMSIRLRMSTREIVNSVIGRLVEEGFEGILPGGTMETSASDYPHESRISATVPPRKWVEDGPRSSKKKETKVEVEPTSDTPVEGAAVAGEPAPTSGPATTEPAEAVDVTPDAATSGEPPEAISEDMMRRLREEAAASVGGGTATTGPADAENGPAGGGPAPTQTVDKNMKKGAAKKPVNKATQNKAGKRPAKAAGRRPGRNKTPVKPADAGTTDGAGEGGSR